MGITIAELTERRNQIEAKIHAVIEADAAAVLSGGIPSQSELVLRLAQDRNVFDLAIEKARAASSTSGA